MRALPLWVLLVASSAFADGPKQGTTIATATLGMNVVSWAWVDAKATTVSDRAVLSEFVGVHHFVGDGVRLGMNLQLGEYLSGQPKGKSGLATVALLPQIGWVWSPFFAALVFTVAPWTKGGGEFDWGLQGVVGVTLRLHARVSLSLALEVPVNLVSYTVGLTPLAGLVFHL